MLPTNEPVGTDSLTLGHSALPRPLKRPGWFTGRDGERYLERDVPQEVYSPLTQERSLDIELSRVEPNEDSIASFVEAYGWLCEERIVPRDDPDGTFQLAGDSLSTWRHCLRNFKALWGEVYNEPEVGRLTLRDCGVSFDRHGMAWQRYAWAFEDAESPRWIHDFLDWEERPEPDREQGGEWLAQVLDPLETSAIRAGSCQPPARAGVIQVPRTDNRGLDESRARTRAIAWALMPPLRDGIGAALRIHEDHSDVSIRFEPKTILATACLQVAQSFAAQDFTYSDCASCGKPFRPAKRGPRQRTCGKQACRMKRYAERRDRAYDLRRREALSPSDIATRIAAETGEPVTSEQVEKWIAAAEKRKGKRTTRGSS